MKRREYCPYLLPSALRGARCPNCYCEKGPRASGIEAGTAETVEQGSVHESPTAESGDAQKG